MTKVTYCAPVIAKIDHQLSSDWDWDLGLGTWDLGPGTWDLGPGTWDMGPGTWDLGPGTW